MGRYKGSFNGPFGGVSGGSVRVQGLGLLGGSGVVGRVVIRGVLSRVHVIITPVRGLITPPVLATL